MARRVRLRTVLYRLGWYKIADWTELQLPAYRCMITGHPGPPVHKFSGVLLCPRCSTEVGRYRA